MARFKHRNFRLVSRWLIPLPALFLAFFPNTARAEPTPGLNAVGYFISGIPTRSDTAYTTCGQEIENNINRNFNGEPFQQCPDDNFMVHYTGTITIPENQTISFMVAADDGGTVKIGDTAEFGTWNLKGCQWSTQTNFELTAGQYLLDGWFFEAGGRTCYMLAWNINGAGFVIVPDSAFTTEVAPTTTSTTTTSSTSTTTTTLPPTTTTTSSSTSTLPPTTVYVPTPQELEQARIVETGRLAQECAATNNLRADCPKPETTTEAPQPSTTTNAPKPTVVESTQTIPETTTSTSQLPPTTTTTLPIQTAPRTTTSQPSRTTTTLERTTPSTSASSSTLLEVPTTLRQPDTTLPKPIEVEPATTIPEVKPTPAEVHAVNVIQNAETVSAVVNIVTEAVSNPTQLETLTVQEIEQVFEELVVEDLTDEQAEQLVEVLTDAPKKVKKAFENKVNVFSGLFNSYKMVGSTIPVGERRTLLAVSNTLVAVGASLRRRDQD